MTALGTRARMEAHALMASNLTLASAMLRGRALRARGASTDAKRDPAIQPRDTGPAHSILRGQPGLNVFATPAILGRIVRKFQRR